jgi:hypothetical protein
MRNLQQIVENQKNAESALKLFAKLRGSEGEFNRGDEAAELIRVLAGPRFIPSYDEIHPAAR